LLSDDSSHDVSGAETLWPVSLLSDETGHGAV